MDDDTRVTQPPHDAVREIAFALGRASGENHEIGLQTSCERASQRLLIVRNDAEVNGDAA